MSRSSIVFARADIANTDNGERSVNRRRLPSLIQTIVTDVCIKIIESYTRIAAALGLRSGKNALRKAFRQAARRQWYRTLKTLRELPLRDTRATRKCAQLMPAWQGLGEALNLDETSEKADYDHEMKKVAQLCAWTECEYHEKKPPNPTRVCAGCGEARYCSRLCQQKYAAICFDTSLARLTLAPQGLERRT